MKTSSITALLLATAALAAGCANDTTNAPDDGDVQEGQARGGLSIGTIGTIGDIGVVGPLVPLEPIVDPLPPPPVGTLARISSGDLDFMLATFLGGSRIVVDTTGKSPTIPSDPFYHCTYPNQAAREAAQAECYAMAGTARFQCLQMMNEDYPNIKECNWTTGPVHSYIDFAPYAESLGATDRPFESIDTIVRDVTGPGSIYVDINNVRATMNGGTIDAKWEATSGTNKATGSVWLTLESDWPALPCRHSEWYLGCPDVELTNMKINTKLTNIAPTADGTQLGFDQAVASFQFNRNLNNIPDAFLTVFVDIDAIIKNNVQKNVQKALMKDSSRVALQKALTGMAGEAAKKNHATWNGFAKIHAAWFENGDLVVDYSPL